MRPAHVGSCHSSSASHVQTQTLSPPVLDVETPSCLPEPPGAGGKYRGALGPVGTEVAAPVCPLPLRIEQPVGITLPPATGGTQERRGIHPGSPRPAYIPYTTVQAWLLWALPARGPDTANPTAGPGARCHLRNSILLLHGLLPVGTGVGHR